MNLRKPIRYLLLLFTAYLLVHVLVYALQEKFFFLEKALHAEHKFNFPFEFEEHFIASENGNRIDALYFKTQDSVKGTILYFHGNAGNLDRWGIYAPRFTKQGYHILMIDYQGYGKSEGHPSENAFYQDGQAAYDWIRQKTSAEQLIIYGRSIGSGVATHIAANNSAKTLILETPFNNMKDVVHTRFPFLYLKFPFRHQFPNDENLPKVDYPVHIFHGTKDRVVPYSCALKLKKQLQAKDHFYTIENGGHGDLIDYPPFNTTLSEILR